MSVILEFSIAPKDFPLGEVLSGPPGMQFELERIVPTRNMIMPLVWVSGEDHAEFEERVRTHPSVKELRLLDKLGDRGLYRVEWEEPPMDLIDAIVEADASVLQARGHDNWVFHLRFSDDENLSQFHDDVVDRGIPLHVDRTYTLTEATGRGHPFDLTPNQREALVLALQRGYFATPREVRLDELADGLGITRQALSNRIRRGNEKILHGALLWSTPDFAADAT